jgi:Xaa-Pro aminopeptidase
MHAMSKTEQKTDQSFAAAGAWRLAKIQAMLTAPTTIDAPRRENLDGFIVTGLTNVQYLTGFTGSSAVLLILADELHFFTDGRYTTQAATELAPLLRVANAHIHITQTLWETLWQTLLERLAEKQQTPQAAFTLGFEAARTSVALLRQMKTQMKTQMKITLRTARRTILQKAPQNPLQAASVLASTRFVLKPTTAVVERTTLVKTAPELAATRAAVRIAEQVYEYILGFVAPGMRECDVAAEISYQARKLGSEGDAFEVIVASGVRGALPHGRASEKIMQRGELVTLDFGCTVQGFHSDLTRTFALGAPSDLARSVYAAVLDANKRAIDAARAGMTAGQLDAVARKALASTAHPYNHDARFAEAFSHSLGHGLGRDVHEPPALSQRSRSLAQVRLQAGSIVTIEPGVYLQDECGVRIEDDVLLLNDGCEVLTCKAPKELIVL